MNTDAVDFVFSRVSMLCSDGRERRREEKRISRRGKKSIRRGSFRLVLVFALFKLGGGQEGCWVPEKDLKRAKNFQRKR